MYMICTVSMLEFGKHDRTEATCVAAEVASSKDAPKDSGRKQG